MPRRSQAHRQEFYGVDSSGRAAQPGSAFTPAVQSAVIAVADGVALGVPSGNIPAVVAITGEWVGTESIEIVFDTGAFTAATGTVTLDSGNAGAVDGIEVDSVELMSGAESFDSDLETTAAAVAANINANTSVPNYTAEAVGTVVTITSEDTGNTQNGLVVVSSTTAISTTDVNMAGAVGGEQTTGAVAISAGGAAQAAETMKDAVAALILTEAVRVGGRIDMKPLDPATVMTVTSVTIT